MKQPSFRELLTAIKKKTDLAPVQLLIGEEAFFIDTLVQAFEEKVIPEEDRDFNLNVFYGNDASIEDVISAAQQFPVMADRKLVILKELQSAVNSKAQLDKLAPYINRPNPNSILVVAYKGEPPAASSKLMKAAVGSELTSLFRSAPVKDWQLPAQVKDYCVSIGMQADEKTISLLCDYIGQPLSKLFGEINKLAMIKGTDKKITAQDVEDHIGISKDYNMFEFTKAIAAKNYPASVKILTYFKKNPKSNPVVMVNANVFNLFQRVVICHFLADKSERAMMDAIGIKTSFQLKDVKLAMQNYNPYQAVNAIHHIRELDAKSKGIGSYQNEFDLLGEMIFKIFTS